MTRFALVASVLVLCGFAVVTAQPTASALGGIVTAQALMRSLEPLLTSAGVTNARNIWTRLESLKAQFKLVPPPAPVNAVCSPYVQVSVVWDACQPNGTQTGVAMLRRSELTPAQNGGATCDPLEKSEPVTQSCTYVPPDPLPSTIWTLTANPSALTAGQSSTLAFTAPTADFHNVFINGQRPTYTCAASSCNGMLVVTPTQTTVYTLSATNAANVAYPGVSTTVTVTGVVVPPIPPPSTEPPPSGAYAYYDTWCQSAEACYSLRTQAQVDQYRYGRGAYSPKVDYDPVQDAAKWIWPSNALSAEQLRIPITLQRPASGSSKLLIISDHRWDSAWLTEFTTGDTGIRLDGWKWLQVTSNSSGGTQQIWFEPQMRFIGQDDPILAHHGFRGYQGVRAPTTIAGPGSQICGKNFGEVLGPMLACFQSRPETWTRIWLQVEERAGDSYARLSAWMADENQNPVQILRDAEMFSNGVHTQFWFEYNTSSETRIGGPLAAWGRNVIVMKDADVAATLQKPVR